MDCCNHQTMGRKLLIRGIVTVIGAFIIHLSLGLTYIFGNYTPYFTSYLRNRTSSCDVTYAETTWIAMSGIITSVSLAPVLGLVEGRIHYKIIIVVSCFIYSGGIILTYYTVQHSMMAMLATYGIVMGCGKFTAYVAVLKCAMMWFSDKSGLITGIVMVGFGLSSFMFNWVLTIFINPLNLTPNQQVGEDKYFTQSSVLDNVPESFLLLGGMLFGLQIIGISLLSDAQKYKESRVEMLIASEDTTRYSSINENNEVDENCENDENGENDSSEVLIKSDVRDYEIKEVLKSKIFYYLWVMQVMLEISVTIISTSYKTYGQTFINNDHFLSRIGSFSSLFNAGGRLFWGSLADKLEHKLTMSIITACFSCFLATLVLTQPGGNYVFFLWVCLITFSFAGIYSVLPSVTLKYFGAKNYLTIYTLLMSSGAAGSICTSIIVSSLQPKIGWKNIFLLSAGTATIGFLISVVINCLSSNPRLKLKRDVDNYQ